MLIDWFTVGAQALNFVILVWLMKRFLYRPVQDAIAAREKRIADQIADTSAKEAEAAKQRQAFEDRNAAFDRQRDDLLARATADANAEGRRLIDESHKAADAVAARRDEALQSAADSLDEAIGQRAQREVFAIARKTLGDLATVTLEERICDVFTRRLRALTGPARTELGEALKATTGPALVRSTFELPPDQRASIKTAIDETFSADIPLRFETAPDGISGVELVAGGRKLAWSIDGYLAELEKGVAALLVPPTPVASVA